MMAASNQPEVAETSRTLLPVADLRQILRTLTKELYGHRFQVMLAVLLVAMATAAGLVAPWIVGWWVDQLGASLTGERIAWSVAAIVLAAIVGGLCARYGLRLFAGVGNLVVARLRERVLSRVMNLSSSTLDAAGTGDVVSRTVHDVSQVSGVFAEQSAQLLTSILVVLTSTVGFFLVDWRLAFIQLVILTPIYVFVLQRYLASAKPVKHRASMLSGELSQTIIGSVRGLATVHAYRLEKPHVTRIHNLSRAFKANDRRQDLLFGRFLLSISAIELVGLLVLLPVGFIVVRYGLLSAGEVTTAILLSVRLFGPISDLLFLLQLVESAGVSLARLVGVVNMPIPKKSPKSLPKNLLPKSRMPSDSDLVFAGVSHRYRDDRWVVSEITLRISSGERVALVGASGAGKSTLALIGAGLLEPTTGGALVGGVPVAELDARHRVCLVTQEVHVFSGPLADDVRLGDTTADDDAVWAALKVVSADSWVRALPQGLHTEVGELGYSLTPAQAQQIALARLVLADPQVVILDEATAEAGSAGARELERAAAAAITGKTALIVAHRLSQAVLADRVVVMDQGRIVETGTHTELVTQGGRYSQLWHSWSGATH